jgi:hypothetical protein
MTQLIHTLAQCPQRVRCVPHQPIMTVHERFVELSGRHHLRQVVVAHKRGRNRPRSEKDCPRDAQMRTCDPKKESRHAGFLTESAC